MILNEYIKSAIFRIARSRLSEIKRFRKIHSNESCYILGDGISLKWFDLGNFQDKITLTSGISIFHNDIKKLNLRYCLLLQPFWFYVKPPLSLLNRDTQKDIASKYLEFILNNDLNYFTNLSNFFSLSPSQFFYLFKDIPDSSLPENFISKRIDCFNSSIRASITLAIYLGFTKVYLLGCDYTHSNSRAGHWYEKGKGEFIDHTNYNDDFFKIAKEYLEIVTVTLDTDKSSSCYIEAVKYQNFVGKEPFFRENNLLLGADYLKSLDKANIYNIF